MPYKLLLTLFPILLRYSLGNGMHHYIVATLSFCSFEMRYNNCICLSYVSITSLSSRPIMAQYSDVCYSSAVRSPKFCIVIGCTLYFTYRTPVYRTPFCQ